MTRATWVVLGLLIALGGMHWQLRREDEQKAKELVQLNTRLNELEASLNRERKKNLDDAKREQTLIEITRADLKEQQDVLDALSARLNRARNLGGPDRATEDADVGRLRDAMALVDRLKQEVQSADQSKSSKRSAELDHKNYDSQMDLAIRSQQRVVQAAQADINLKKQRLPQYWAQDAYRASVDTLASETKKLEALKSQKAEADANWSKQDLNLTTDLQDRQASARARLSAAQAEVREIERRINEWKRSQKSDQQALEELNRQYEAQKSKVEGLRATLRGLLN